MVKPTLVLTAGALQRRAFLRLLRQAGTLGAASAFGSTVLTALAGESGHVTLPFENGERDLVAYPQKRIWPVYAESIDTHFASRLTQQEAISLLGLLRKLDPQLPEGSEVD